MHSGKGSDSDLLLIQIYLVTQETPVIKMKNLSKNDYHVLSNLILDNFQIEHLIFPSSLPGLLQFCLKVVPAIGERILGPILNQVKYPTTCMSITTFAFKWPNRTSQLCKRESVDKMGGVVTTGMGGICLNWALCLRFVLTIAICLSI